ncbi:MAG TPA: hypothetical protein VGX21_20950 [Methylomirabilota bacterium]|jgi:hypothetical protein|nr:hypothetical protein [Methylomirabilota bacterium]
MARWQWRALLVIPLAAVYAACGGGSGQSGATTGPTTGAASSSGDGADAGSGGGGSGGGGGLSLNTANFRTVSVAVTPAGAGTVSDNLAGAGSMLRDCAACAERYRIGTGVVLTARSAAGFVFERWQGDECDGSTSPSCAFTVERPVRLSAVFR